MQIEMTCRTKPYKRAQCSLSLQDGQAELKIDNQDVLFSGSYTELDQAARFPSFTESIKYFGVRCDGHLLEFVMSKKDAKAIRAELDGQVITADPEKARRMRQRSWIVIAVGIAAIIAGPVATYISYQAVPEEGGEYTIWYGFPIFGIVFLGYGLAGLLRVKRAQGKG
jgi:hypothetical protein